MRRVLVTGGAGFVGSHLVDALVAEGGWDVTVVDSFDDFYDPAVKEANLAGHVQAGTVRLVRADVADDATRQQLATDLAGLDVVVHVAAKAGVRPSLQDPAGYYRANVTGTDQVMRLAAETGAQRVVHISSSSVYGTNPRRPWREDDLDLRPVSPYAASKVASEAVAHTYHQLHGLEVAVLRLFTVYGPRQRPDLAIHHFARTILAGEPITLFGDGTSVRDYTYVADIVDGIRSAMTTEIGGWLVANLGAGDPIRLIDLVRGLEEALGVQARIEWADEQPGDVPATHADITRAHTTLDYAPAVARTDGLAAFAQWLVAPPQEKSERHSGAPQP